MKYFLTWDLKVGNPITNSL